MVDFACAHRERFGSQNTLIVLDSYNADVLTHTRAQGLDVLVDVDKESIERLLLQADLVHVGFWNTPQMYAWLGSHLPAMRLVMTLFIAGEYPAQVITAPLVNVADAVIATSRRSMALVESLKMSAASPQVCYIPAATQWRSTGETAVRSRAFRVGYVGAVEFVKMNPRFIALCAAVQPPEIQFPVAGSGAGFKTLQRQAEQRGITSRFEWLGYQPNPNTLLRALDVFGYPLCRETYATTDLIVQEAMMAGVPPVILPYGGVPDLVAHNITGLIVDEDEYSNAISGLAQDESKRARLSANARAYAHGHFGVNNNVAALHGVYESIMQQPKRDRRLPLLELETPFAGGAALIQSFGDCGENYRTSLLSQDVTEIRAAEEHIARASPVETNAAGGGVSDYLLAYPDDAMLRLWAGLILAHQKRNALAAANLHQARRLGLPRERIDLYLNATGQWASRL